VALLIGVHFYRRDLAKRRSLVRLARVAEATASAVVVTDIEGVTVWVNAGFTCVTGYSFDEAVGRTPGKLLQGSETNPAERARIGTALRARKGVAAELINYGKDGRKYWVGMKIEPLTDSGGRIDGFMAIETDITESHQRRQALDLLTRRFDMATQSARVGMYERDTHSGNVWWSEVMCEIFGQDPGTFQLTWEVWLALVHPEDREYVRSNAGSADRARISPNLQYRIVRPDGAIRHVQSIGSTEETAESVIAGIVIDVTERAQSEEREYGLQQQLREASHQAGIAEFATGVLHNVGNVLNSLGIANTTALRELKRMRIDRLGQVSALLCNNRATLATFLADDEHGRHFPDYLLALSEHLAGNAQAIQIEMSAIDELLHHLREIVTAQQASAQLDSRYEPIDLRDLAESALLLQASQLSHIEVVRLYDEVPRVMTDRHKLLQILVNFLSNARDAVLASTSVSRRIVIRLGRDGTHAVISIEDSGVGMSEEILSRLWRFGFTTKQSGHGFGLHNSANAAHAIGATLAAHSDGPGQGSKFELRVPLDDSLSSDLAA